MDFDWHGESLVELEARIWRRLEAAVGRPGDPWRTPVLSSMSPAGVTARVVVLRAVDPAARQLVCHTDRRSPKVGQLRVDPRAAWTFYDGPAAVQLRATGEARVWEDGEVASRAWEQVPAGSRRNYATTHSPGTVVAQPPEAWDFIDELARHFCVVVTTVDHWDWLWLAPDGHRRAELDWRSGPVRRHWLVP